MNFGIEQTKKIIGEKDFPYKHNWESAIWEIAPKEMLNVFPFIYSLTNALYIIKSLFSVYLSNKPKFVFKELLKCSFHRTEAAENSRSFTMYNLQVLYTNGIKKLRNYIWQIFSRLYSNNEYIKLLNEIISYGYISGLEPEEAKKIQQYLEKAK